MHNFKVGDSARVVYTRNRNSIEWCKGAIVTIHSLESGDFNTGRPYECTVLLNNGLIGHPLFEQLEPVAPEEVSWEKVEEITNWNPTKETVV